MVENIDSEEARRKRLKVITKEILALTKELESLVISGVFSPVIEIGDKVVITNNHRGLQGSKGTVISKTKARLQVKLDSGLHIYRAKTNVRKIE
jgi:glycine/serine hydroxymethyltransferase